MSEKLFVKDPKTGENLMENYPCEIGRDDPRGGGAMRDWTQRPITREEARNGVLLLGAALALAFLSGGAL